MIMGLRRRSFGRMKLPAVIWLTGLPGSGKSTIANGVLKYLLKNGKRAEHLDGDEIRSMFPQTGFSKEERNNHIRRVGHIAAMLEKHDVTVIASFISPYREARDFVRSHCRRFIEVYVATPLEVCEQRDPKGLYKKARKGEIRDFTGIDDPYEEPVNPELRIDTTNQRIDESIRIVINSILR
jgi:adenylylsulfate kinase